MQLVSHCLQKGLNFRAKKKTSGVASAQKRTKIVIVGMVLLNHFENELPCFDVHLQSSVEEIKP